ncbi:MAG: hypothetical protein JSV02_01020, partial [Dehalococcoidia bacterium]
MEKELWGHKFKVVDKGLDEAEVTSFVENITEQQYEFSKKLEHVESLLQVLTRQYADVARTMIEAAKRANNIIIHAQEQAASQIGRITADPSLIAWQTSDEIKGSAQLTVQDLIKYVEQQSQTAKITVDIATGEPSSETGNTSDTMIEDILKE